jgi:hypothetical protein
MKRFLVLMMLASLPGCVGFEENYYEETAPVGFAPPASSCGCQAATYRATSAAPANLPVVSQLPAIQTREPDLR